LYMIPIIKEVMRIRPDIFLYSAVWSEPGWMKTSGAMCGGSLLDEYLPAYANYVAAYLKEYKHCGRFRGGKRINESNLIFFKKDKFKLIDSKTLWLSNTPEIPRSKYEEDQSKFPRIITIAKLETKDGKIINVFNTHFDHQGKKARILSSKQIVNYIKIDEPVILTGDLNSNPEDEPIKIISKHLTDITSHIPITFHHFGSGKINTKIDYIFVNDHIKYQNVKIIESKIKGMYLSDHHPIYTEFIV